MTLPLLQTFNDRSQEIDSYIALLAALERATQVGPPKIGTETITPQQTRILYSSVYLHLYNLVESTATGCVDAVTAAATAKGQWLPGDLTAKMRREWVRTVARTHANLSEANRLEEMSQFCDSLVTSRPLVVYEIDRGGGGNWDDEEIFTMANRLGIRLNITKDTSKWIKQPVREELGMLSLVKLLRNRLAHGKISFAECGNGVTVEDLVKLKTWTVEYLRQVIESFVAFIEKYEFLMHDKRPKEAV